MVREVCPLELAGWEWRGEGALLFQRTHRSQDEQFYIKASRFCVCFQRCLGVRQRGGAVGSVHSVCWKAFLTLQLIAACMCASLGSGSSRGRAQKDACLLHTRFRVDVCCLSVEPHPVGQAS